jgi:uncharacterized cupredoxin-like copper-binding protein
MRRYLVGALGTVAAAAVLTACGSGSGGTSAASSSGAATTTTASSGSASSSSAAGATQTVMVTAKEYSFSLSSTHFAPGTYTFRMSDAGSTSHAIEIQGPGVSGSASSTVGPGGTASLTVTLQNGTYTLFCPVDGHRALGMQTTLTVG